RLRRIEEYSLTDKVYGKRIIIDADRSERKRSSGIEDWPEGVRIKANRIIVNLQEIKIIADIKPEISVVMQGRLSIQEEFKLNNAVVIGPVSDVLVDQYSIRYHDILAEGEGLTGPVLEQECGC